MGRGHEQKQQEPIRTTQARAPELPSLPVRFPDFVCIGAQKAGTTWLHDNLAAHPNVWLPPVKELHYFDQLYLDTPGHQEAADERRRQKATRMTAKLEAQTAQAEGHAAGLRAATLIETGAVSDEWYGSVFALAPPGAVCGEITGAYALLPKEGIDHLVDLVPNVKILFLLRDPIDRAWSHVKMLYRRWSPEVEQQFKPLQTLELDPRVLSRSQYSQTLGRYRRRIDDRSIWIGDFDQLTDDPAAFLASVCAFLGVEFDERLFPDMHQAVHGGLSREIDPAAYERLKAALEPEYDELAEVLPEPALRWRARHFG